MSSSDDDDDDDVKSKLHHRLSPCRAGLITAAKISRLIRQKPSLEAHLYGPFYRVILIHLLTKTNYAHVIC